jgi:hypothetical protein
MYAWYAAKLVTPCEVFCCVNQVAFPLKKKLQNATESKHWIDVCGVINVCFFGCL